MIKRFAAIIGILLMIFTALPVQAAAAGNGSASAVMQSGRTGTENKGHQAAARGTDIFRYLGNGWHKRDGSWFYLRNGKALTGWIRDGGKWYFLGRDGKMKTGWVKDGGKWYYLTSSGAMKTGWLGDQGKRYYLTSSGAMKTGWMKISGKWYYFTRSGAMKTGWLKDKGKWYYLLSGGAMKKGWLKIGGKTYYLTSGGTRKTGWLTLKGKKYYFGADGVLDAEKTEEADKAGAAKDTSSASSAVNEIKETGNKAETENTAQSTGEKKTNAGSRARTKGELVAQYALQFVGNPYVYGGNSCDADLPPLRGEPSALRRGDPHEGKECRFPEGGEGRGYHMLLWPCGDLSRGRQDRACIQQPRRDQDQRESGLPDNCGNPQDL